MYEEFRKAAEAILETAHCKDMLIRNPDAADLKALAMEEPEVRQTKYGSICAYSEPMSARQSSPSTTSMPRSAKPSANCWSRPNAC